MSSFYLKIFAIIFMLIDHIGFVFFPSNFIFRAIGRIAFPLFAFQIGIGYSHTKNKKKHILIMLLFAILSQIPFSLMCGIHVHGFSLNVLFTFLFALIILYLKDNIKHFSIKAPLIFLIFLFAFKTNCDYGIFGVLLTICLYYFQQNKVILSTLMSILIILNCFIENSFFGLPAIFSIFFILLFNFKKGPNLKWFFYIFYPCHMLILFFTYNLLNFA